MSQPSGVSCAAGRHRSIGRSPRRRRCGLLSGELLMHPRSALRPPNGLFTVEGVAAVGFWPACRWRDGCRGLPRMGVLSSSTTSPTPLLLHSPIQRIGLTLFNHNRIVHTKLEETPLSSSLPLSGSSLFRNMPISPLFTGQLNHLRYYNAPSPPEVDPSIFSTSLLSLPLHVAMMTPEGASHTIRRGG